MPFSLPNLYVGTVPWPWVRPGQGRGKQCQALMCLGWMHDGSTPGHLSPCSGLMELCPCHLLTVSCCRLEFTLLGQGQVLFILDSAS